MFDKTKTKPSLSFCVTNHRGNPFDPKPLVDLTEKYCNWKGETQSCFISKDRCSLLLIATIFNYERLAKCVSVITPERILRNIKRIEISKLSK